VFSEHLPFNKSKTIQLSACIYQDSYNFLIERYTDRKLNINRQPLHLKKIYATGKGGSKLLACVLKETRELYFRATCIS
jgi:hypothetical protein